MEKNQVLIVKNKLQDLSKQIQEDFEKYLRSIDYSKLPKDIVMKEVSSPKDISTLPYGEGFYIILTNYKLDHIDGQLIIDDCTAIYRGHCGTVKARIMSHLANDYYKENDRTKTYKVCLKMEDGVSGINVDQQPYNSAKWIVIVHKMSGSSKLIREQMEYAYDEVYGRPCRSLEVDKKK